MIHETQIKYEAKDIEEAFELHYSLMFPIRSRLLLFLGLALLLGALILVFVEVPSFPKMKWMFLFLGLFYLGFHKYRKSSLIKLAMNNPTIQKMNFIRFDDKSIVFGGNDGQTEQLWSNFMKSTANETCRLIYLSTHNFFILPKRFFSTEAWKDLAKITKHLE